MDPHKPQYQSQSDELQSDDSMPQNVVLTDQGPRSKVPAGPRGRKRHLDAVEAELRKVSPGLEGTVWKRTAGNKLDADTPSSDPLSWILQIPDCWGKQAAGNTGISRFLKKVTSNIAKAEHWVDISAWGIPDMPLAPAGPYPAGAFFRAIGDGLKQAAARKDQASEHLKVRVLTGLPIVVSSSPSDFLGRLREHIGLGANFIDFNVAAMSTSVPRSQNHTKFVVVDGNAVIHGGINWMPNFYERDGGRSVKGGFGGEAPVTDLDIALRGPVATYAGRFLDVLWDWVWSKELTGMPKNGMVTITTGGYQGAIRDLYKWTKPESEAPEGDLEVIAVGSLGSGIRRKDLDSKYQLELARGVPLAACRYGPFNASSNNETNIDRDFMTVNPDAHAIRALVESAQQNVVLSQQDINGFSHFPMYHALYDVELIDALIGRMVAGVDVRIVLSNPGYPDYSNIDSLEKAAEALLTRAMFHTSPRYDRVAARNLLKTKLQLATLRVSANATWPNGYKYRLHTKVVCVDDEAFYVGSRNAYPDTTQDHGFIIEDHAAAQQLKSAFFDKQWQYSQVTCYQW
jgi:phosphatidylserine/phosphatidylglycerophosphate/cardiolipin synthase-like enzyme